MLLKTFAKQTTTMEYLNAGIVALFIEVTAIKLAVVQTPTAYVSLV